MTSPPPDADLILAAFESIRIEARRAECLRYFIAHGSFLPSNIDWFPDDLSQARRNIREARRALFVGSYGVLSAKNRIPTRISFRHEELLLEVENFVKSFPPFDENQWQNATFGQRLILGQRWAKRVRERDFKSRLKLAFIEACSAAELMRLSTFARSCKIDGSFAVYQLHAIEQGAILPDDLSDPQEAIQNLVSIANDLGFCDLAAEFDAQWRQLGSVGSLVASAVFDRLKGLLIHTFARRQIRRRPLGSNSAQRSAKQMDAPDDQAFMTIKGISEKYKLPYDPLRRRLERLRDTLELGADYRKQESASGLKAIYVFRVKACARVIESLTAKTLRAQIRDSKRQD